MCKIEKLNDKSIKEKIKEYKSDMMVLTVDFSQNKEQINHLLFFAKVAKYAKQFLIIFDIDFAKCKLNNIIVFNNKKFKELPFNFEVGGFFLRFYGVKIAFVIGDNIYKKSYKKLIRDKDCKNIVHIDLYDEGVIFNQKRKCRNINIISTKYNGFYELKK